MIKQIAYTSYPVTDMNRAVEFYQKVLGFTLLFHREDWSEFEIAGQRLALQKVDMKLPLDAPQGAAVSFMAEPIEEAIETLKKNKVRFIGQLQIFPYGKLINFLDPDNNILGLYEPAPKK